LGENTADNGGARVALAALEHMIADDKSGKEGQSIDGYTPEQRFFLGFGRVWCEKQRPEYLRMQVSTNPHSPGKYRVNGVEQDMLCHSSRIRGVQNLQHSGIRRPSVGFDVELLSSLQRGAADLFSQIRQRNLIDSEVHGSFLGDGDDESVFIVGVGHRGCVS